MNDRRSWNRNFDLTEQQLKFCEAYLLNGRIGKMAALEAGYAESSASVSASQLIQKPAVRNYLNERITETTKTIQIDFNYKVAKLKKVVDLTIPDDAQRKEDISARDGIAAISELNKMQGDYSAEKHVNATINIESDLDLKQARDVVQKLVEDKTTGY